MKSLAGRQVVREETIGVTTVGALAASDARKSIVFTVQGWGMPPEVVDPLALCASEVLSNALTHGGGADSIRVAWMSYGRVRVEVTDLSPKPPVINKLADLNEAAMAEALMDISGRGLDLVDEYAVEWGWLPRQPGKVVWVECDASTVPLPSTEHAAVAAADVAERTSSADRPWPDRGPDVGTAASIGQESHDDQQGRIPEISDARRAAQVPRPLIPPATTRRRPARYPGPRPHLTPAIGSRRSLWAALDRYARGLRAMPLTTREGATVHLSARSWRKIAALLSYRLWHGDTADAAGCADGATGDPSRGPRRVPAESRLGAFSVAGSRRAMCVPINLGAALSSVGETQACAAEPSAYQQSHAEVLSQRCEEVLRSLAALARSHPDPEQALVDHLAGRGRRSGSSPCPLRESPAVPLPSLEDPQCHSTPAPNMAPLPTGPVTTPREAAGSA